MDIGFLEPWICTFLVDGSGCVATAGVRFGLCRSCHRHPPPPPPPPPCRAGGYPEAPTELRMPGTLSPGSQTRCTGAQRASLEDVSGPGFAAKINLHGNPSRRKLTHPFLTLQLACSLPQNIVPTPTTVGCMSMPRMITLNFLLETNPMSLLRL